MLFSPFVLLLGIAGGASTANEVVGLPLTGPEAVEFLHAAEVKGRPREFDSLAITDPRVVTLSDGTLSLRAIFKDVDKYHMIFRFADGRVLTRVYDSYKHEIAAYELNVLLGLDIVPPCVERTIRRETGSLCLWVEDAITEDVRKKRKLRPPNAGDWNHQMYTIRLFHQLIWDPDYNNIRNILVDANFKLYNVDSSLSFRTDTKLRNELSLTVFCRRLLASLEFLERSAVDDRLGPWLNRNQLDALWERRTRLLELAKERVAARGADVILDP